jgi:hypothetical protein
LNNVKKSELFHNKAIPLLSQLMLSLKNTPIIRPSPTPSWARPASHYDSAVTQTNVTDYYCFKNHENKNNKPIFMPPHHLTELFKGSKRWREKSKKGRPIKLDNLY